MLNLVSIAIGVVALVLAVPGFIPLLGWMNWFIVPLALVGAGIGALSRSNSGRNLNLLVMVVAIVRLSIGGGFV